MLIFPKDFILGAATAAYQVEGATKEDGKGRVLWDSFLEKQGRFLADPASDFYHRYEEDIKLAKDYGIKGIRISIAWSRIFPNGYGKLNKKGVDYYHKVFKTCLENNIIPYVTLHHFDSPENVHLDGDFLNISTVNYFVDYARFCFEEFKEVKNWITINEPGAYSQGQYVSGSFPPGIKYRVDKMFQAQHYLNLASAKAINLFKELKIDGEIGSVQALSTFYPIDDKDSSKIAAKNQDVINNKFLLDATLNGYYSKETLEIVNNILKANNFENIRITKEEMAEIKKASEHIDFLGINYYQSSWVKECNEESFIHHNGTGDKGTSVYRIKGVSESIKNTKIPTNDWDWYIYPKGLYDLIKRIEKDYPNYKKIYITENGLGMKEEIKKDENTIIDIERINYVKEHLQVLSNLIKENVNIKGYFIWSMQDMFSWSNGYNKRYGLFYVDFETQKRYIKESARWYKKLSNQIDSQEFKEF